MKHIDGSTCSSRKSMPRHSEIAKYWCDEKAFNSFEYLIDWGEPSCWACGFFLGSYDIDLESLKGNQIFNAWNKHSYLERCHILAKSFGGCNCEANLVLLCQKCHKASPDTRDTSLFVKWVKNRQNCFALKSAEYKRAYEELEYAYQEGDEDIVISEEFKRYCSDNIVVVGGSISVSSFVASFIEYKQSISS